MFGVNGYEFVVLALVGLIVLGPDKLPKYIADAAQMIRRVRRMASEAQDEVRRELGPEFADFDLADLDPRKFVSKHLFDIGLDDDEVALRPADVSDDSAANVTSHSVGLDKGHATERGDVADLAGRSHTQELERAPAGTDELGSQSPPRSAYDTDTT